MTSFPDHFSTLAGGYARYRPRYPSALFDYLASVAPRRELAWDVGTGNGQAALELAQRFEHVVASDASAEQIAQAPAHERIEYRVERAEDVSLQPSSVDLVTVAIAVHWFDLDAFYAAVRGVSSPGGVLAVWTYHLPAIEPGIDRVLDRYYAEALAGFWPAQSLYVHERYRNLPFPFDELSAPELGMQTEWDLHEVVGFLESWSATRLFREQRGHSPVSLVWDDLLRAWGEPSERRTLRWPLHLRSGRVR